jgi:beta-glucosidase
VIRAIHHFPHGFLWGTATSSHQVEGNNANNDWWIWEHETNRIAQGHQSGQACDWWGGRWSEDFDRAMKGGQNAHRLSIEWSRVEPTPAIWDDSALDYYRQIIKGALDRGLMPMVSLHHFTIPQWVSDRGGWYDPQIVHYFERYTRKVVMALQDLVGLWVTINEPNVYYVAGYLEGVWPPGKKNIRLIPQVIKHLVMAHAAAYHAIHEIQPGGLVGLAHNYRGFRAANPRNPFDRWLANFSARAFNEVIPRAVSDGRIHFLTWRGRVPQAVGTQDFFGLNYYTVENTTFSLQSFTNRWDSADFPEGTDLSPSGFIANEPSGMWEALGWAHQYNLPIYITENGIEDAEDRIRPRYLALHLREVWKAANFNWRVRGYFHWSLVDNFEWERGWTQRFGLWQLDTKTQERTKRPSADMYEEICKSNGLSSETVAMYAPEVLDTMFPPRGPAELVISHG